MTAPPVFDLPTRLAAKAGDDLTGADEAHFTAMAAALDEMTADLKRQLDQLRQAPARAGQELLERDLQTQRLAARLRLLGRYRLDVCLGRMVTTDGQVVYVGRVGIRTPPAGSCSWTGVPRPPDRSSRPPWLSRWVWPAGADTAGQEARSSTTGTSSSHRVAPAGSPRS